ncbi:MAG: hypothetical protein B7Z74_04070 [Deltaproteobacteria bacterium 21-66-5]|nr:MAG: hypothetical protein B7Z74_04070 [Deltaproteobacteria bacterium 21-66-5]
MTTRRASAAPRVCRSAVGRDRPQIGIICGEKDDAIRPEWEQRTAREYLHVEPVVVKFAGHANIIWLCAKEVVDAATKGL